MSNDTARVDFYRKAEREDRMMELEGARAEISAGLQAAASSVAFNLRGIIRYAGVNAVRSSALSAWEAMLGAFDRYYSEVCASIAAHVYSRMVKAGDTRPASEIALSLVEKDGWCISCEWVLVCCRTRLARVDGEGDVSWAKRCMASDVLRKVTRLEELAKQIEDYPHHDNKSDLI